MSELKPCECGGEPVLCYSRDGEVVWAQCKSCGVESPLHYHETAAATDWNAGAKGIRPYLPSTTTRTPTELERELVEALEGMVALYDSDEGCRSLPQVVAALAVLSRAQPQSERTNDPR